MNGRIEKAISGFARLWRVGYGLILFLFLNKKIKNFFNCQQNGSTLM